MDAAEIFKSVQFLVDGQGRPRAVQLGMSEWKKLLEFLEDQEDRAVVKEALHRLSMGPAASGALSWENIQAEWDAADPGQ